MICILGGTFDPIHFGHLRPALDVQQALGIERVHLLPARLPPHRDRPRLADRERLALVRLAIANEPALAVDERELEREGPSYMVDTLHSLRRELGETPLCLALGMDAFAGLPDWHRWTEITKLCHLVVMRRPDNPWPTRSELTELVSRARVDDVESLRSRPAGCIYAVPVTQLSISSTQIRGLLANGRSPRYLLPDAVIERIMQENWYAH